MSASKPHIYRSGLHFGEEPFVVGNEKSGMILFSGCHLRCSFCYTPEVAFQISGREVDGTSFLAECARLRDQGARNINLISPTHVWRQLGVTADSWQKIGLPLILKVTGSETGGLWASMTAVASVVVPDFKVATVAAARAVNLPSSYGANAMRSIEEAQAALPPCWEERAGKAILIRGVVVRHLVLPHLLSETGAVLRSLAEIRFAGPINLMTHFWDTANHRITRLDRGSLNQLLNLAGSLGLRQIFVDGKSCVLEEKYAVA